MPWNPDFIAGAAVRRGAGARHPFLGAGVLEGGCAVFTRSPRQRVMAVPMIRSQSACPRLG
jgi:hypothetical protein